MRWINYHHLIFATFLSILSTNYAAALSETKAGQDQSYQRMEHEFVLSPRNEVAAYCEPGDVMIKGGCEGRAQNIVSEQVSQLNDSPRPSTYEDGWLDNRYFETREINEQGRAGFACRAKLVRPEQELRLTAAVTCKKSGQAIRIRRTLKPQS